MSGLPPSSSLPAAPTAKSNHHSQQHQHQQQQQQQQKPPSSSTSSSTTISSTTTTTSSSHNQQQQQKQQQQNPNFDSNVISERVKSLATQIYQELKRIISRCNYDQDILSGLMPLIVRVLESLDLAIIENQQLQVELELCKDDNEQLVIMFEKEKAAKRAIDKKLIESEYAYEEERQQYQQKIESLDNVVKMMELKAKNASDQAARFEEKEAERKKEYQKLHDRYTELLKSHCDVVERVRHLVGNNEVSNLGSINVPQQMVAISSSDLTCDPQIHQLNKVKSRADESVESDRPSSTKTRDILKSWNAETELTLEDASLVVIEDVLGTSSQKSAIGFSSSQNESERVAGEIDGGENEKESENDSIAYTSMEKEFRKLIQDNKDLLNTKNALNVVKDDLIAEVDRLTNEVSMYEQAVEQLNATKEQTKHKVSTLDAELRKTKEELEKAKQKIRENNEEGVPYSQRKRFGRAEMAKVLMERNEYKEKFMELQDTVRYTELVRANSFSNLFGAPPREPLAIGPGNQSMSRNSSPVVSYLSSPTLGIDQQTGLAGSETGGVVCRNSIRSINPRLSSNSDLIVLMDSDLNIDRGRAGSRDGTSRLMNSEGAGYIHAYGWSLPISSFKGMTTNVAGSSEPNVPMFTGSGGSVEPVAVHNGSSSIKSPSLLVPIPQYCRPLTGDSVGMKIWCAAAIDLNGGELNTAQGIYDGSPSNALNLTGISQESSGSVVNITSNPVNSSSQTALKQLEEEVDQALKGSSEVSASPNKTTNWTSDEFVRLLPRKEELSSCVWICGTQHSRSKITIIDIKTKPNELMDSFYVPTFIYCIKSIPGCKSTDLPGLKKSDKDKSVSTMSLLEGLVATQKQEFYKIIEVDADTESRALLEKLEAKRNSILKDSDRSTGQESVLEKSLDLETKEAVELPAAKAGKSTENDAEIAQILDNDVSVGIATLQKLNDFVAHTQPHEGSPNEASNWPMHHSTPNKNMARATGNNPQQHGGDYQPISTHLPTVWMGGKDSVLYLHSAIGQWKDYVSCLKLPDSILQIFHFRGRVFVALADGSLCVFFRDTDTKQWNFNNYLQIDISLMADIACELSSDIVEAPESQDTNSANEATSLSDQIRDAVAKDVEKNRPSRLSQNSSSRGKSKSKIAGIRCIELANKNLWIGYRNRVLILDPITLKLKHTFNVVPQLDNQIRQLVAMKDGVFCCLRSDLVLRLYSSLKPYQHIQNIDIEPVVTRLLSPRSFVISHITAMKVADNMLWIGNAHGIIITIPCDLVSQVSEAPSKFPGEEDLERPESLSIARFVPKCDINWAQISFHGHKDAVKFFIHAHGLMLSGGQGYVDFRLDMDDQSKSINDKSHLILWQLPSQTQSYLQLDRQVN